MKTITNILEWFWILVIVAAACMCFSGCGTMYKMEEMPDGTFKEIPVMRVKSLARDLSYSCVETTTTSNGTVTIKSETYSTKGTTAGIIGAGAGLLGAASSLSPF